MVQLLNDTDYNIIYIGVKIPLCLLITIRYNTIESYKVSLKYYFDIILGNSISSMIPIWFHTFSIQYTAICICSEDYISKHFIFPIHFYYLCHYNNIDKEARGDNAHCVRIDNIKYNTIESWLYHSTDNKAWHIWGEHTHVHNLCNITLICVAGTCHWRCKDHFSAWPEVMLFNVHSNLSMTWCWYP